MSRHSSRQSFDRRRFIGLAAVAGAGLAARPWHALGIGDAPDARWSDARTWRGARPGPDTSVRISQRILVDQDATVAGVEIEPGGELVFDPDRRVTLRSSRNVIVRGSLKMHPSSPQIVHRLVFVNVNEGAFEGGGMDPIGSDVGLWVVDHGRLDIRGSRKRAWTRATTDVNSGEQEITLEADPAGWRTGDEIALTPTRSGATDFHDAKIRAIDGRTIQLSTSTTSSHPKVPVGPGLGAEVLNLTRNVRIEGRSSGRSHIFIRSSRRQTIKNAAIRYMGPRQGNEFVAGRYGIHFHMCGRASRGSVVGSVVIRDCGSHAFVPHNSHGITFRDCISYETWEEPYWWDPRTTDRPARPDNFSNGITYDHCVAALVRRQNGTSGDRLAGFWLGTSTADNSDRCVGCVAVGVVDGERFSSGFHWPEGNLGVWVMEDCVAHNNVQNGIFTWQNTPERHVIDRFIAYHNGKAGIEHGAYANRYLYRDSLLYGNGQAGVIQHARSTPDGSPMRYERITVDGAGITPVGFLEGDISFPNNPPVVVCGATITGVGADFDDGAIDSETFAVRQGCS
jgi:G8 domain